MGRPVRVPVSGVPMVPGPPALRPVEAVRGPARGQLLGGLRLAAVVRANRRRHNFAPLNPVRIVVPVLQVGGSCLSPCLICAQCKTCQDVQCSIVQYILRCRRNYNKRDSLT
jgi:hypothetical protein